MNVLLRFFSLALLAMILSINGAETFAMNENNTESLSQRQRDIIAISAFTANGQIENLDRALAEALDNGLSVSEIKEILVQLYAYAGFPRSLNGIHAFMRILDERKAKGVKDSEGKAPSPMPDNWNRNEYGARVRARLAGQDAIPAPSGYQLFAPAVDQFLKEHLFADIFARDNLDYRDRELTTIAALASVPGLENQLQFHMGAAMNVGLTSRQMREFVAELEKRVGKSEAQTADSVLVKVLAARKK